MKPIMRTRVLSRGATLVVTSTLALMWQFPTADEARAAGYAIIPREIVGDLKQAVSFAFDARGRIWFVEKAVGDVRVFDPASGTNRRFFEVPDIVAEAEQGLDGIALAPGFPDPSFVYVAGTTDVIGSLQDQLIRIRDDAGRGTDMRVLWASPASVYHEHSGDACCSALTGCSS